MESPRKFNDCYFYYYSTCTKGDNCVFRHEPAALGCEMMCTAWQQGKCLDKRCKLRHMELRKNRKQIPCYWENQPGGCRKKHCSFMHKNPDARTDGIAPSQPGLPIQAIQPCGSVPEVVSADPQLANVAQTVAAPAPAPLPFWQQQRQMVTLDSAILGVLPPSELLGRRVLGAHAHAHAHAHGHAHDAPNPYAPLPVDPLVVNFEEESDNESAPSSTPTKTVSSDDAQRIARTKSQELLLLEKIQAEAAAFYSYDAMPSAETTNDRKIVRTNLTTKYDRMSLDELSGKKQQPTTDRRKSLDFKVMSLDEIRAKKKTETIVQVPITLNLSRKRKLSTQEAVTTSGNKIIKVVRSNSIVYKQLDKNGTPPATHIKPDQKSTPENVSRKRTLSELSDMNDTQDDELVDNCYEFKRIKIAEQISKPKLIRNKSFNLSKESTDSSVTKPAEEVRLTVDNESDSEVQIVSVENNHTSIDAGTISDTEIIDVDSTKMGEPVAIVDLSDDEDSDVAISDLDLGLVKNVPDVVASCRKTSGFEETDKDILSNIDAILNDNL